uniref:Uncharacterized protein n=1 Tax=Arundo donax TaxID=35708 RepID=A0A0A9F9Y6_ARUDO
MCYLCALIDYCNLLR